MEERRSAVNDHREENRRGNAHTGREMAGIKNAIHGNIKEVRKVCGNAVTADVAGMKRTSAKKRTENRMGRRSQTGTVRDAVATN